MNAVSTTPTAPVSETLPPVECAPWCEDGAGHTDAFHPLDQYCYSPTERISLIRQDVIEGIEEGSHMLDYLCVYLLRDRFDAEPHIALGHADMAVAALTPAEALELARLLTLHAGAAQAHTA